MKKSEYPSVVVTQHRLIQDLEESTDRVGLLGSAWYPKMPETKIVRFLKQFPWVRRLINADDIWQVFVSGIDPAMFSRPMRYENSQFSCTREYAFLVDKNGDQVSSMTEEIIRSRKYIFFGPVTTKKKPNRIYGNVEGNSTIQRTVERLGDEAEKIEYILSFDNWTKVAIVYKRPKWSSFSEYIKDGIKVLDEATE